MTINLDDNGYRKFDVRRAQDGTVWMDYTRGNQVIRIPLCHNQSIALAIELVSAHLVPLPPAEKEQAA